MDKSQRHPPAKPPAGWVYKHRQSGWKLSKSNNAGSGYGAGVGCFLLLVIAWVLLLLAIIGPTDLQIILSAL
jgi:hypothetical protein